MEEYSSNNNISNYPFFKHWVITNKLFFAGSCICCMALLPKFAFAIEQCQIDSLAKYTAGNKNPSQLIDVDADSAHSQGDVLTFYGNVVGKRGQEVFNSDKLIYQKNTGEIDTPEGVIYGAPAFAIRAKKANYKTTTDQGIFSFADYYFTEKAVIGSADKIDVDRKTKEEKLTNATYTTCPRVNPAWHIKAGNINLDHNKEEGEAWNTKFYIGQVPVFYFPYLTFPLSSKRKTGFLMPSASASKSRGTELTVPYYFNIAPNQDLTLSPTYMTKRGFMLGADYRYLAKDFYSDTSSSYLNNDNVTDSTRWQFDNTTTFKYNDDLSFKLKYNRVSDKYYLNDFDDNLDLNSPSFLESYLNAYYRVNANYDIFAQVQDYQIATPLYSEADKPYRRVPKISGNGTWFLTDNILLTNKTEVTRFAKDNAVDGMRVDNETLLSYSYETPYSFFTPTVSFRLTQYDLNNQTPGEDSNITRSIPVFSLDYGLYLDKKISWFGTNATQTLEPRLFYLYAPYRNQDAIPNFDTSLIDTSYDWLFLRNRFTGADRIGDANQLTTAISSSIINDKSGLEMAKFSLGQIQYFQDRKVSLTDSIDNQSRSDIVGETSVSLNKQVKMRGLIHYDMDAGETVRSIVGISYQVSRDKFVQFSHLYDNVYYKQVDLSGVWRINEAWRSFWRWNYSIKYDRTIDMIAGLEYSDCCWAVRLMGRHENDSSTSVNSENNSVYLEFVLKGLGNVGSDTKSTLKDVIPGYQPLNEEL